MTIRETDGVLNLVHWLGKPAVIKDSEMESLKSFLTDYSNVSLEKIEVNVNDDVKVIYRTPGIQGRESDRGAI